MSISPSTPKRSGTVSTPASSTYSGVKAIAKAPICGFQLACTVAANDGGPSIEVVIDLLMPRAVIEKNKPPLVTNFAVQRADGADLALKFYQMVAIDGGIPDGGRNRVSIAVAENPRAPRDEGSRDRQAPKKAKDAYDIYYCVRHYPGGVDQLVTATMACLEVEAAVAGYRDIATKFRTVDDYGPISVRRFVDRSPILGQRTPDQWQQDAFG